MMKSVFWWRKPEYPEETTDLRQVTDKTFHTYGLCPVRRLNLGRSGVKQSERTRDESGALAEWATAAPLITKFNQVRFYRYTTTPGKRIIYCQSVSNLMASHKTRTPNEFHNEGLLTISSCKQELGRPVYAELDYNDTKSKHGTKFQKNTN